MRFRFTLFTDQLTVPAPDQPYFPGLSAFTNTGTGTSWSTGPSPVASGSLSKVLRGEIIGGIEDVDYQIDFNLTVADLLGGPHNVLVRIRLYDSTFTSYVDAPTAVFFTNGSKIGFVTLSPTFTPKYVGFLMLQSSGAGASVTVNSYDGTADLQEQIIPAESLEITEPDGWKDCTLKLERHPEFHSLIEHFEGDFTFFGQNEFVNGGIDFLKEKIRLGGVDVQVRITIDLALDDVNYENVFTGQLAIPEVSEMINNKMKCNVIREDFWTKFIKRLETPVNLQSGYSLDGDELTIPQQVNLNMTPQKLLMVFYAIEDFGTLIIMNQEYIQFQPSKKILDELKEVSTLARATNSERPVWIFEPEYDGTTLFNLRVEYSKTVTNDGSGHTGARTIYDFWFQKNDETPIEFTYTSGAYIDPAVYANWPFGTTPPGDDSVETTIASFYQSMDLIKGDVIRVYLQRDTATDNNITFWGNDGLFADKAGAYPLKSPRPAGMQENPTFFRIEQNTIYPATNAEGFLIHDVPYIITERLIGQLNVFYSDLFGALDTLRMYDEFGCAWFYMLLKGLQIRQYSLLEKPFFISFKQWWEGANPIFNLGLGYEVIDFPPEDEPTVDSFGNGFNQGSGTNWAATGFPGFQVSLPIFTSSSLLSFEIFNGLADATYEIGYDITTSAAGSIVLRLYDESFTSFVSVTITVFSAGNHTGTRDLVPTFVPKYLSYRATGPIGGINVEIDPFTFNVTDIPDEAPFTCIRVEKKEHFYDSSFTSVYFSNIRQIEWSFDGDHHFNLIRIGYNKWESEEASGLDDPQTKSQYNTRFKRAGKTIDLYSSFIAGGLTIETTRRKTKEKSADYKFDNDTFIVAIKPDVVEISPETSPDVTDYEPELDENFSTVDNLLNPETRYNLRLTPARNLIRWIKYLSSCLQKYLTSSFSFASGEGNYDMVSEMIPYSPDCDDYFLELAANGNIPVSPDHMFIPKLIEMDIPMTWEDYLTIRQYRKNPIGISQTDSGFTNLFIKELSFKPIIGRAVVTGWPDDDFELIVPSDEFEGNICLVSPPEAQECSMITEEGEDMITEDNELMVLEECD